MEGGGFEREQGERICVCGGAPLSKQRVQFNRPREGNEAVTIEHVVRDVFTDGALWPEIPYRRLETGAGEEREGKERRGKGREEKERGDLWVNLLPT